MRYYYQISRGLALLFFSLQWLSQRKGTKVKAAFSCIQRVDCNISISPQVFVNFAKQQSREDDAIVLHPKAAGAQRYIDTAAIKSLRKWT